MLPRESQTWTQLPFSAHIKSVGWSLRCALLAQLVEGLLLLELSPGFEPQDPIKAGLMAYTNTPSIQEVEAGKSKCEGHRQLHKEPEG